MLKKNILNLYKKIIFQYPVVVLIFFGLLIAGLSPYLKNFRLDASSDSLVLENDESLKFYRQIVQDYGSADFLVLTYSPKQPLFTEAALNDLKIFIDQLTQLEGVNSSLSILNVPMTQSPPVTLNELASEPRYLLNEKTDLELARAEFQNVELYRNFLVSPDEKTTGILLYLAEDAQTNALFLERNALREQRQQGLLDEAQLAYLEGVELDYRKRSEVLQAARSEMVDTIRELVKSNESQADIFLGGLPMIISDSVAFIESDVVVFGAGALIFVILTLVLAFRHWVWVALPLVTCFVTAFIAVAGLGLLDWPITVVSANFVALLLIITLSILIHLIVRYRELREQDETLSQQDLLYEAMTSKFIPCFYTAITTMVAFASLIVSGIRPVIDFGWIMCFAIFVALFCCFTLFPALATFVKPTHVTRRNDWVGKFIAIFARFSTKHSVAVFLLSFGLLTVVAFGISRLSVENRFIDYFKSTTEINQGMRLIDEKLGGTTPLDIVINAPQSFFQAEAEDAVGGDDEDDEFFDMFEDEGASQDITVTSYWFNPYQLRRLMQIQDALEAMPETGKVLSVASGIRLIEGLKGETELNSAVLALLYNEAPEDIKETIFAPYMTADGNQVRFNIRVFETEKGLQRDELLARIEAMLVEDFDISPSQFHTTGMFVLYNNMLNSLFDSQIKTLGAVFLLIFLMMLVLFRSARLAICAVIPNILAATSVLGIMGLVGIPLDLMTITIAAICMGIAVDNSIHYVHRFNEEYLVHDDKALAVENTHTSTGKAMYYTTLVITFGFLVFVFSNFVPTIYFGLLTGVAMVTALTLNLNLLPALLYRIARIIK